MAEGDARDTSRDTGENAEPDFDPYRFGKPDTPPPPEYAPPGYKPDTPAAPANPYPYGAPPYGQSGQYGQQPGKYGQYPSYPGQAPYGAPPVPVRSGSNGKATAALVLGIVSIVLCWLTIFALVIIIPAVVFGILGLTEAGRRGGQGRNMAIAGIACTVIGAVLAVTFTVLASRAIEKCGGASQRDEPGFQQCVQDNLF